jgi:hypothetical protein
LVHSAAASCSPPGSCTRLTSSPAWSSRGASLKRGDTELRSEDTDIFMYDDSFVDRTDAPTVQHPPPPRDLNPYSAVLSGII